MIAIGIVLSFMLVDTDPSAIGYVKQVQGSMRIALEDVRGNRGCMEYVTKNKNILRILSGDQRVTAKYDTRLQMVGHQ